MKLIAPVMLIFSALWSAQTQSQEQQQIDEAIKAMKSAGMPEAQVDQIIASVNTVAAMAATVPQRETTSATKINSSEPVPKKKIQPSLASKASTLQLKLGGEAYEFDLTRCTTQQSRNGNLIVLAEATAVGRFRGEPAIVFLHKSHPSVDHGGTGQMFEKLDIWLGEFAPAERTKTQFELSLAEDQAFNEWYNPKAAAVMSDHQVNNNMSAEEINAAINAQSAAYEALEEQAKQHRKPKAHSYGAIDIDGQRIRFLSDWGIGPLDQSKARPFLNSQNISVEVVADCSDASS